MLAILILNMFKIRKRGVWYTFRRFACRFWQSAFSIQSREEQSLRVRKVLEYSRS